MCTTCVSVHARACVRVLMYVNVFVCVIPKVYFIAFHWYLISPRGLVFFYIFLGCTVFIMFVGPGLHFFSGDAVFKSAKNAIKTKCV